MRVDPSPSCLALSFLLPQNSAQTRYKSNEKFKENGSHAHDHTQHHATTELPQWKKDMLARKSGGGDGGGDAPAAADGTAPAAADGDAPAVLTAAAADGAAADPAVDSTPKPVLTAAGAPKPPPAVSHAANHDRQLELNALNDN